MAVCAAAYTVRGHSQCSLALFAAPPGALLTSQHLGSSCGGRVGCSACPEREHQAHLSTSPEDSILRVLGSPEGCISSGTTSCPNLGGTGQPQP
jgi:hypothetical protein